MPRRKPARPPEPAISHQDLMLATPGKLFAGRGWVFELKYDGFRCLARKCGERVELLTRNGNNIADRFPELVDELRSIDADLVLDGELVMCDEIGRPEWSRLHKRHMLRNPKRIAQAAAEHPACIFAFDLLWYAGEDYRHFPLVVRKAMLVKALRGRERVKRADHFENDPVPLWELAVKLELEGIMAKDAASTYRAGRTTRWMKIKTAIGAARERARRR